MANNSKQGHNPFWMPWGAGGCLWRSILFLLGMILICLLLSLLMKGCDGFKLPSFGGGDDIEDVRKNNRKPNPIVSNPDEEKRFNELPEELKDTSIVDDWNEEIPDVEELPDREDNFIPPIDSTDVVKNPQDSTTMMVAGRLIVFFKSDDVKKDMASFARQFKQLYPKNTHKITYYNPTSATMLLAVPNDDIPQLLEELPQKITGIDFIVTTDDILQGKAKPADPGFSKVKYDEYYKLIQAYEAWDITRGSKDVKVAIVDSYFDLTNPEIGERYVDPINIATKRAYVLPPFTMPRNANDLASFCHGSHVAGLAIGGQNNKLGCSGIAPECTWIPVALGTQPLSLFYILEGVQYAIYKGADVINMSVGLSLSNMSSLPISEQVRISKTSAKRAEAVWDYIVKVAEKKNCIIVRAAGNDAALLGMDYMNRSKHVIHVEAVDNNGIKAKFSNFGIVEQANVNYSTVAAPGVAMWSVTDRKCAPLWNMAGVPADAKTGFQEMDGTSMSSPVVAGAVALLKSKNKDLPADEVIKILKMTGKQTDTKNHIGPTIQIKDALDATGGDLAKFDELIKDHNKLIGKWRSTHELQIESSDTHEKIDDMWTYFIFTSPTKGTLENHGINTKRVYRAGVTVQWQKDKFIIKQNSAATTSDGQRMNIDDYICAPNKDGLVEVEVCRNGVKRYNFQLEKVK